MLPAGKVTDSTVEELAGIFSQGDVIVDGGNSNYKEWIALSEKIATRAGWALVDAGTSGGVWGLTEGYCLMVGGTKESVAVVEPALPDAGARGRLRPRRPGGRRPLRQDGPQRHRVRAHAGLRRGLRGHGAATSSTSTCTRSPPSGATARWCAAGCSSWPSARCGPAPASTASRASWPTRARAAGRRRRRIDRGVPAPVITTSLFTRFASQEPDAFQLKMLAALRNQFGGHAVTLESGQQGMEIGTPTP